MGRPYPNRRKKRPGRRPPHHYRGGYQVRPNSFQDFGAEHVYDWIFGDIRGRDRRKLFNGFSGVVHDRDGADWRCGGVEPGRAGGGNPRIRRRPRVRRSHGAEAQVLPTLMALHDHQAGWPRLRPWLACSLLALSDTTTTGTVTIPPSGASAGLRHIPRSGHQHQ